MKATHVLLITVVLATGCSSQDAKESASEASPSANSTETPVSDLVGRWEQVLECQELTSELKQAGLGPLAPYAWLSQTSSTGQSSSSREVRNPRRPIRVPAPSRASIHTSSTQPAGSAPWIGSAGRSMTGPMT